MRDAGRIDGLCLVFGGVMSGVCRSGEWCSKGWSAL